MGNQVTEKVFKRSAHQVARIFNIYRAVVNKFTETGAKTIGTRLGINYLVNIVGG